MSRYPYRCNVLRCSIRLAVLCRDQLNPASAPINHSLYMYVSFLGRCEGANKVSMHYISLFGVDGVFTEEALSCPFGVFADVALDA